MNWLKQAPDYLFQRYWDALDLIGNHHAATFWLIVGLVVLLVLK